MPNSKDDAVDAYLDSLRRSRAKTEGPTLEELEALAKGGLPAQDAQAIRDKLDLYPEYESLLESIRAPDPRVRAISRAALATAIKNEEKATPKGRLLFFPTPALRRSAGVVFAAAAALLLWFNLDTDPQGADWPSSFGPVPTDRSGDCTTNCIDVIAPGSPRTISPSAPQQFKHVQLFDLLGDAPSAITPASLKRPWSSWTIETAPKDAEAGVHQLILVYSDEAIDLAKLKAALKLALQETNAPPLDISARERDITQSLKALGVDIRVELSAPYRELP